MSPCSSTQIDHLSIACCMKGKCMHAVQRERKREGEREWKSGKEVITQTASFLSLFTLSPCLMSPMSFPLSLPSYIPPFLSLSPQRNPVSPLGLKLFEGDPELYRSLPPLSSLPTALPSPPPPSTLHPQLPPLSPQGAWIPLNWEKPCSKSQPGLSAPAAGLAGCPLAPQRQRGGRPGRRWARGDMTEEGTREVWGERCVCSRSLLAFVTQRD